MTQPTITDLLAGLIDLAPSTPPHRPGSCSALCVPTCATDRRGHPTSATRESTPLPNTTAVIEPETCSASRSPGRSRGRHQPAEAQRVDPA
jgi:hypothetical protein